MCWPRIERGVRKRCGLSRFMGKATPFTSESVLSARRSGRRARRACDRREGSPRGPRA